MWNTATRSPDSAPMRPAVGGRPGASRAKPVAGPPAPCARKIGASIPIGPFTVLRSIRSARCTEADAPAAAEAVLGHAPRSGKGRGFWRTLRLASPHTTPGLLRGRWMTRAERRPRPSGSARARTAHRGRTGATPRDGSGRGSPETRSGFRRRRGRRVGLAASCLDVPCRRPMRARWRRRRRRTPARGGRGRGGSNRSDLRSLAARRSRASPAHRGRRARRGSGAFVASPPNTPRPSRPDGVPARCAHSWEARCQRPARRAGGPAGNPRLGATFSEGTGEGCAAGPRLPFGVGPDHVHGPKIFKGETQ